MPRVKPKKRFGFGGLKNGLIRSFLKAPGRYVLEQSTRAASEEPIHVTSTGQPSGSIYDQLTLELERLSNKSHALSAKNRIPVEIAPTSAQENSSKETPLQSEMNQRRPKKIKGNSGHQM